LHLSVSIFRGIAGEKTPLRRALPSYLSACSGVLLLSCQPGSGLSCILVLHHAFCHRLLTLFQDGSLHCFSKSVLFNASERAEYQALN
jgi:hypothetical protein